MHFGTDGIRGLVGTQITPKLGFDLGRAVAAMGSSRRVTPESAVVVGHDPRPSSEEIAHGVARGVASAGATALECSMLPTPAIARAVRSFDAAAGIVVTASHNPVEYNGLKVFGPKGRKLTESQQNLLQNLLHEGVDPEVCGDSGTCVVEAFSDTYVETIVKAAKPLKGLRLVMDCANGAMSEVAPRIFERLGATVEVINAGDGSRINDNCGATYPEVVAEAAARLGCVGIAFDGDGDRVLASDEQGRVIDGDGIVAILGRGLKQVGTLANNKIGVTVMSNLALTRWAEQNGIELVISDVGDRALLQVMESSGACLGAEQSGHIIVDGWIGDGAAAAAMLLGEVVENGGRLSELVPFEPFPQRVTNIAALGGFEMSARIADAIKKAEASLGNQGRVFVRPSGTEPVVRVMVEASQLDQVERVSSQLVDALTAELV